MRLSKKLTSLSDSELERAGREIRWRAMSGISLHKLLPEAYALVREATQRVMGFQHYQVQIMGGIALFEGHIAEMQTGEGKTITAVQAAFLRGLVGKGCHVVTVNDYLAERDAKKMGPIYNMLGLSVGRILADMESDQRRAAYACDITYGTSKEMGFDFLRDRIKKGASEQVVKRRKLLNGHAPPGGDEAPVQRGHYFALIDEADSILIDEARTPLIIGLIQVNEPATINLLRWSHLAVNKLKRNTDYVFEADKRSSYLTDAGCRKVLLMSKPSLLDWTDTEKIYSYIEKSITAQLGFQLDRDYVVNDDKIVIVDESTGRMMDGRKWQDGLHQSIEAKERVPITAATGQAARVTVQTFYREYIHLSGMTGTAIQAKRELKKIYHMKVSRIPTNKPCIRKGLPTRVFSTAEDRRENVADEIAIKVKEGRAVLVGTPSVDASEALATLLRKRNVKYKILNAKYHAEEADIVKDAGEQGKVTIATNMAGRGTDIILDDVVRKEGGLHVIATEMHSSSRIDRQLVGRAARQGDPGSFQFFLSLEDELFTCLAPEKQARIRKTLLTRKNGEVSASKVAVFRKTQKFLEKMHRKQRKDLLKSEKQKLEMYQKMGLDPFLELTE